MLSPQFKGTFVFLSKHRDTGGEWVGGSTAQKHRPTHEFTSLSLNFSLSKTEVYKINKHLLSFFNF